MSLFASKTDGQSGSSCACGSGTNSQTTTWPSFPQFGNATGSLDIRTESSEFSLSRSLNALLPQDVKLESIEDFKSSTESAISSIRIFSRNSLPPYPVTAKAIDKFYLSTGQLFYILEEHEARDLLKIAYTEPQKTTLPMVCQLFAIAAVGSLYDDLVPFAVKQSFFQTARFYLDDCLEADDFQTMRVLLLLALFCILEKRVACWKYIGQGLQNAHSRGIHLSSEPPTGGGFSKIEWIGWRKTWRSLVFLDSWLAGTLGLLPYVDPVISHSCIDEKEFNGGPPGHLGAHGPIRALAREATTISAATGANIDRNRAHEKSDGLPHALHVFDRNYPLDATGSEDCWLTTFGEVACQEMLDSNVLKGHYYEQFSEDVADARKCISALEYCAQDDEVSRCYLDILRPFRELLSRNPGEARDMLQPPEPPQPPPTSPQTNWGSMSSVLGDIDGIGRGASPSPSTSPDSVPTPGSPAKRLHSVGKLPRWKDAFSTPKIYVQHPGVEQAKRRYSEKDMKDLETLLRRVA